jgi:hypothetical protein
MSPDWTLTVITCNGDDPGGRRTVLLPDAVFALSW